MRIFNRSEKQKIVHEAFDPKTGKNVKFLSMPRTFIDVPEDLAKYWLDGWPHIFTLDNEAIAAERRREEAVKGLESKIATQDTLLADIATLIHSAGESTDKRAASKAAEALDKLLAEYQQKTAPAPVAAPAAPALKKDEPDLDSP